MKFQDIRPGMRVRAVDDDYEGLVGLVVDIRDGEDKETENETPDIYVDFDIPESAEEVAALERRFSALYGEPKKVEELPLDLVIMAPDMLEVV